MMASTYLSSFSPIRQYCPPSNQREYQNSKLNLLEKQGKNVTVKARKFRCVNAANLIETQAENGAAGAYVDRSQAKDFATVLGIGTANPPNVVYQEDYPDVYFRSTNSEQMTSCKEKMERMCEATMIKKRHFFWDDEQLQENPSISHYMFPSFDVRSRLTAIEIPKLGHEAALRAISDWGQPKSKITHLIFATSTGINIPGFDFQLIKLLGLNPSIKRYMVYMQGCYAGGTALRMAKDLAENNEDARVLIVCCENVTMGTRGPNETDPNALISQALFADGAAAVIVGDGKSVGDHDERPLFQLVSTDQTVLPNSEGSITTTYSEAGLVGRLDKDVPDVISNNIEDILIRTLKPIGLSTDWNNIFWISHPGGRAILDIMEEKLGLNNDKLETSRHVLSEYGNMSSPSVIFVMDAMRNKSIEKLKTTTGDGLDWGVLLTMGPGITVETILLRSVQL